MVVTIITSLITMVLSSALGYCVSAIKNYKSKLEEKNREDVAIKEALKYLIQSHLTNVYNTYKDLKQIPDYLYKNWLNLFRIYKALGGNEFVDKIAEKMAEWELIHTDIL